MRNLRKSMLSLTAVVVMAPASACGLAGGGGTADGAGCVDAPLTYQLSYIPNAQQVGFLYAYDRGYFQAEGVDIEMRPGGPTVNPALQVAQGNVDVAELPLGDALNAVANGAEIKLVAQVSQQIPLRYISWKDVPLATPKDLVGKTVGVQQAGNLAPPIKVMIGNAGIPADAVQIKQIAFDVSDFMARNIDVFPLRTYAHIAMLEEHGVSYPDDVNVLNPADYGADLPEDGIYVNAAYLEENRTVVACALRAIRAGWQDAKANPAEAKRIVAEFAPAAAFSTEAIDVDVDEALVHATQNGAGEVVDPLTLDVDYVRHGAESLQAVGEVPEDVRPDSLIDLGPLEEAVTKR
jgi:NitT/TauT family transport system substrate-binding protein